MLSLCAAFIFFFLSHLAPLPVRHLANIFHHVNRQKLQKGWCWQTLVPAIAGKSLGGQPVWADGTYDTVRVLCFSVRAVIL